MKFFSVIATCGILVSCSTQASAALQQGLPSKEFQIQSDQDDLMFRTEIKAQSKKNASDITNTEQYDNLKRDVDLIARQIEKLSHDQDTAVTAAMGTATNTIYALQTYIAVAAAFITFIAVLLGFFSWKQHDSFEKLREETGQTLEKTVNRHDHVLDSHIVKNKEVIEAEIKSLREQTQKLYKPAEVLKEEFRTEIHAALAPYQNPDIIKIYFLSTLAKIILLKEEERAAFLTEQILLLTSNNRVL